MKSEDLLRGIGEVSADLLAQTEQSMQVRTAKPRWGLIAAVLALIVGLGGLTYAVSRGTPEPGTSVSPSHPEDPAVSQPASSEVRDVEVLPIEYTPDGQMLLTVGDNWKGEATACFVDLAGDLEKQGTDDGADFGTLPVYKRTVYEAGYEPWNYLLNEEELETLLTQELDRLGLTAQDAPQIAYAGAEGIDEPAPYVAYISVWTQRGQFTVYGDGSEECLYWGEPMPTCPEVFTETDPDWKLWVSRIAGLDEYRVAPAHPADANSTFRNQEFYPVCADAKEQLLARSLLRYRIVTVNGNQLSRWKTPDLRSFGGQEGRACYETVGEYPVISLDEAKARVRAGQALCEELDRLFWKLPYMELGSEEIDPFSLVSTELSELVYLPEEGHACLIPFYRFWIQTGINADNSAMYTALYVPAVDPAYLSDYPRSEPQPDASDAPEILSSSELLPTQDLVVSPFTPSDWSGQEAAVYRDLRETLRDGSLLGYLSEAELTAQAKELLDRLSWDDVTALTSFNNPNVLRPDGTPYFSGVAAESSHGMLRLCADGSIYLDFAEPEQVKFSLLPGVDYRTELVKHFASEYSFLLSSTPYEVVCAAVGTCFAYPADGEPLTDALSFRLDRMYLTLDDPDGQKPTGLYALTVQRQRQWLSVAARSPLASAETAWATLKAQVTDPMLPERMDACSAVELVYQQYGDEEVFWVPCWQFSVVTETEEGLFLHNRWAVPAVDTSAVFQTSAQPGTPVLASIPTLQGRVGETMLENDCGDYAPPVDNGKRTVTVSLHDEQAGKDETRVYDLADTQLGDGEPVIQLQRECFLWSSIQWPSEPVTDAADRAYLQSILENVTPGAEDDGAINFFQITLAVGEKTCTISGSGVVHTDSGTGRCDYLRVSALVWKYASRTQAGYDGTALNLRAFQQSNVQEDDGTVHTVTPEPENYKLCVTGPDLHLDLDLDSAKKLLGTILDEEQTWDLSLPPAPCDWTPRGTPICLTEYFDGETHWAFKYEKGTRQLWLYPDGTLAVRKSGTTYGYSYPGQIETITPDWDRLCILENAFSWNKFIEELGKLAE